MKRRKRRKLVDEIVSLVEKKKKKRHYKMEMPCWRQPLVKLHSSVPVKEFVDTFELVPQSPKKYFPLFP